MVEDDEELGGSTRAGLHSLTMRTVHHQNCLIHTYIHTYIHLLRLRCYTCIDSVGNLRALERTLSLTTDDDDDDEYDGEEGDGTAYAYQIKWK